ncbi:neprilysin-2-like isoform X2 [Aphidius gifuensis]|nr:neprilysin-2-like isoform X2 [Aphidius gifuensis]
MIRRTFLLVLIYQLSFRSCEQIDVEDVAIDKSIDRISTDKNDVCTTPACIIAAQNIDMKMNKSVDPCDDFYHYVCGNFINTTVIPDDKIGISSLREISYKLNGQLDKILNKPSMVKEPEPFKFTRHLYRTCMDTVAINKLGEDTLLKYVDQIGGWPVLKNNQWNEILFDWKNTILKINENNYWLTTFFKFEIKDDYENMTKHVHLNEFSSEIARRFLIEGLKNEKVINYFNSMINMSIAMGANKRDDTEEELKKALEFEIELVKLTRPSKEYQNKSLLYNPMTLGELKLKYSYFPWEEIINYYLQYSNTTVNDNEIIIVNNPVFFTKLDGLINKTPKRDLANFVIWYFIQDNARFMSDKIQEIQRGRKTTLARWIQCTNILNEHIPIIASALYARNYVSKNIKENINSMVKTIGNRFSKQVENSNWMDDETKKNAQNKIRTMTSDLVYPDELFDDEKLNEYYKDLKFNENNNFIDTILCIKLFNDKTSWNLLRQNENGWEDFAKMTITVNSFYDPSINKIIIPAGILQGEFFDNELPQYMNYGGIGKIIGHEMMHTFDIKNCYASKNVLNWQSKMGNDNYIKKAQCIIDQYGNYTVKEVNMNLNGSNSLVENIADIGGTKVAYLAYQDWLKDNKLDKKLLSFTQSQMFWISLASSSCSKDRIEILKYIVSSDAYSPAQFRVNGPLSNIQEFSKDFKCQEGSIMNPKIKCTI